MRSFTYKEIDRLCNARFVIDVIFYIKMFRFVGLFMLLVLACSVHVH